MNRTFEALGTVVSIAVDDDVPNRDLARMLVVAYRDATGAPDLAFHLRGGREPALVCEGRYTSRVENIEDLVPLFELDLYQALVEEAAPGWLLHAAALERDGRAFVLAGPSGAGKTTLALALLGRGWRLITEEIVMLDRRGMVRGLARPIHVASMELAPRGWSHVEYEIRARSQRLRTAIVQPPPELRMLEPLPLGALARIGHSPRRPPELAPLTASSALARLWACTLRQDDAGLATATALVARSGAHELASSSVEDAVQLAERLATY